MGLNRGFNNQWVTLLENLVVVSAAANSQRDKYNYYL
jgi:hypothetical protein